MALSRKYDRLFLQLVPMPLWWTRALSYMESGLNPMNVTPPGAPDDRGARGLMQVMNVNRADYNAKHGTAWTSADMFDPEKNVRVFADTVTRILKTYIGEGIPTTGHEGMLMVTAGWNSGYGDVRRLARWLKSHSIEVNHRNLFRYAPQALSADSLYRWTPAKENWQRRVVSLAEREEQGSSSPELPTDDEGSD